MKEVVLCLFYDQRGMKMDNSNEVQAALAVIGGMDPASDEFKKVLAQMLVRIDPHKPFGTPLFNAIARVSVGMSFEGVLFRLLGGKLEVYLRQRSQDETAFPGEWHVPGSFFRPGEKARDVADRLASEFGTGISHFTWVGQTPFPEDERGSGMSQIHLVEMWRDDNLRLDDHHGWFWVEELPAATVHSHRDFVIPIALEVFRRRRGR